MEPLRLPATLDALGEIGRYVKSAATTAGLEQAAAYSLRLAVDEIATNIITYGYQEAGLEGEIEVSAERSPASLEITLSDTGRAFDPRQARLPSEEDLARPLEDRPVGGLGIFLALQGVDDFRYESNGGRNRSVFIVRRPRKALGWASRMTVTLRTKMVALIGGSTALLLVALVASYYFYTRAGELGELRSEADLLSSCYTEKFRPAFERAETVARMTALSISGAPALDRQWVRRSVRQAATGNPDLYGVFAAFRPDTFGPGTGRFAPYCCYKDGQPQDTDITYDYSDWEYYRVSLSSGELHWTEPYFGPSGQTTMVTVSVPILRDGTIIGVAGADLSLAFLTQETDRLRVYRTGYAFIASRKGTYVSFPDHARLLKGNLFEWDKDLARRITGGTAGFLEARDPLRDEDVWLVHRPIPKTGLVMAVVYPRSEVMESILSLGQISVVMAGVGLVILILLISFTASSLTKPLCALVGATGRVASGDLKERLTLESRTWEFQELTRVFNKMIADLRAYIENLRETTAARERIESELQVAKSIQLGVLPRTFPPFPDRPEFDVYAMTSPAQEVGGDFYDFFFVDERHLCFLVGDVSEKGVPAALFMMVTKALLRREAAATAAPQEILHRVNNLLCPDNESSMFVTIFCAVLNVESGALSFCSAGHNPPLLRRKGKAPEFLRPAPGFVVGGMLDTEYEAESIALNAGDLILLYTDGVTEARNRSGEFFGEDRLERCLADGPEDVSAVIESIHACVRKFAFGEPQSDDITMLALRFNGGRFPRPRRVMVRPSTGRITSVHSFLGRPGTSSTRPFGGGADERRGETGGKPRAEGENPPA